MKNEPLVRRIQDSLNRLGVPAWLFYDFRFTDPLANRILGIHESQHSTRRWFYLVPAQGTPAKLVHRIESSMLDHLPGKKLVYLRWQDLRSGLEEMLRDFSSLAMQYSPEGAIPYVSKVDAGTVELVRSLGKTVTSSADLVQSFEAVLTPDQLREHHRASRAISAIVLDAFRFASSAIRRRGASSEAEVRDYILGTVPGPGPGDRFGAHRGGQPTQRRPSLRNRVRGDHADRTGRPAPHRSLGEDRYPRVRLRRHHVDRLFRRDAARANEAGVPGGPPGTGRGSRVPAAPPGRRRSAGGVGGRRRREKDHRRSGVR